MIDELASSNKAVGVKQSTKAVESGLAKKAFIAQDTDDKIKKSFEECCNKNSVEIEFVATKTELGKACNIEVGAAVAVLIK